MPEIRYFPIDFISSHKSNHVFSSSSFLAYKDETVNGTMTSSVIDLRPSPTTLLERTDMFYHQPYSKLDTNALNKTNEHCRSLFNLLPTSLRSRHHRQILTKKGIDAVSMKKKVSFIASYCRFYQSSDTSFNYH